MTWNGAAGYWEGCWTPPSSQPCQGLEVCLRLSCPGGGSSCNDFDLEILCDGTSVASGIAPDTSPSCTCDPLSLVFSNVELGSCCLQTGTFCNCDIEITQ